MDRIVRAVCIVLALAVSSSGRSPDLAPAGISVVQWKQIRAEYQRHRHAASPENAGFQAHNFEQQWQAHFDGRGLALVPDDAQWRFGLELTGVTGTGKVTADVNRILYQWSDDLEEWFVNDTQGLEHGFTLRAPAQQDLREMVLRELVLNVRGGLQPRMSGTGIEFTDGQGTALLRYHGLAAWDSRRQSLPSRMSIRDGQVVITVDTRGASYPITIDPILQQVYVKASNTDPSDQFGGTLAISGDTLIVGAPGESSAATGVNGNQNDNTKMNSGAAYVFVRNSGIWSQQAYLKASTTRASDVFGISVSISGDTVVVGARGLSVGSGAAYVFLRSGTTWTQQAQLLPSVPNAGDFGISVSISGDTVAVGAQNEGLGTAYVFARSGTVWNQAARLTGSVSKFGQSVAVSGQTVVVGAPGGLPTDVGTPSGAAYVFVLSAGVWVQQASFQASNASTGDFFGHSVAISGDTAVVGAQGESSSTTGVNGNQNDTSAPRSGAAYVFVRSGTAWSQQAYVKASNTNANDSFGFSVAISGDALVVGAPSEASNAVGVNGNQADNSKPASGAAYLFVRDGSTLRWNQQDYIKASNTDAADSFGVGIAVSSDTVVVGAPSEDGSSKGIAGNQADNSAANSGAAYVFSAPAPVIVTSDPPGLSFATNGPGCAVSTGNVTPLSLTLDPGVPCTLTFGTPQTLAGTRYAFSSWENSSANLTRTITSPASGDVYTATFTAQYSLNVSVNPAGLGLVKTQGMNCGSNCTAFYDLNTALDLTAQPPPNYVLLSWGRDCSPFLDASDCFLTMDANKSVTATYGPIFNTTLNVTVGGAKSGPATARLWQVMFKNNGPGSAPNISITGFTLAPMTGPTCSPTVTPGTLPILLGTLNNPLDTTSGTVPIDFSTCSQFPPLPRFKGTITYTLNFGAATYTVPFSNQFQ